MGRLTAVDPDLPRGRIVRHVDLYYPGQQDPIGLEHPATARYKYGSAVPDPLRYVVWICRQPDLFPNELSPRIAYHITQVGGGR